VGDVPTWAKVLLFVAGALAVAVLVYVAVFVAVRHALRAAEAELRRADERSQELLRTIATAAEYVADVADAWAQAEAERRSAVRVPVAGSAGSSAPPGSDQEPGAGHRHE
jgi:hypothetical protein